MAHAVEPELLGTLPRRIRAIGKRDGFPWGFLRVFILPHMVIGIGLLLGLVSTVIVADFGTRVTGTVVEKHESDGSDDGPSFFVTYLFHAGRETVRCTDQIEVDVYRPLETGRNIPVQYFPKAPRLYSIALPPGRSLTGHLHSLASFVLFWDGVLFPFVWLLYYYPYRTRRLYTHGRVAIGTVIGKKMTTGDDGNGYSIRYSFAPDSVTPAHCVYGRTSVVSEEYVGIREGDELTILYDSRRPRRNIAYRFGHYKVC